MKLKSMKWGVFACMLGMFLLMSVPVRAQVSGATLSGIITDAQGGAVPNAKISIKNVATAVTVDTATNAAGAYTAANLNPGNYVVSISAPGFKTSESNVTLTVGAKQEMNLALTVGEVSQTVEVTGAAVQIDLASSTISGNVEGNVVRELPLNGRDWASLATLEPGVASVRSQYDPTVNPSAAGGRGLAMQLSIGGGRPTQNSYRLDGAIVNDYSNSGPASVLGGNLGVDAIQEFSVLTSDYSAEYGFTSGGVINAITKSGTNTFHGSLFEFVRNDKFDAANYFINASGLPKNPLRQNQFGGSGGWRILKDKLFLFGNYEGVRQAEALPHTDTTIVPSVLATGTVVNLSTGNSVTVPIDPTIKKFFGFYPQPSPNYLTPGGIGCLKLSSTQFSAPGVAGGCNPNVAKFLWEGPQDAREDFYTFRSDFKITDKDSLFGTYLHDYSTLNIPLGADINNSHFTTWRQAVVLEETHVFSPSVLNVVRLAYNRTQNDAGTTTAVNPLAADPSLAEVQGQGFFAPSITLTGAGVTTPAAGTAYAAPHRKSLNLLYEFYDDAFVTKGNHSMKFGFTYMPDDTNAYHDAGGNGSGTFTYQGTYNVQGGSQSVPTVAEGNTGAGTACYFPGGGSTANPVSNQNSYDQTCGTLVNFLTNQPRSANLSLDKPFFPMQYFRNKVFGSYFQDDWRIRKNLTLNLGLRYEMTTIPTEIHDHIYEMPSLTTKLNCGPTGWIPTNICPVPPLGLTPGDPLAQLNRVVFTHNPTLKNFEPRIGFAWDPFHNGKTSVRGGFGIFDALPLPYELVFNATSTIPFNNPYGPVGPTGFVLSPNQQANAPDQFPYGIASIVASLPASGPTTGRALNYVEPAPKRNYVYQWNFNIQRQITPNLTVLLGYAGSRGFHNPFQADSFNTIIPNKAANGDYYWPGCFGAASGTKAGQNACLAAATAGPACTITAGATGTTYDGNLSTCAEQGLLYNPSVGNMMATDWQSRSWYNGLTVKVDKKMSHGFQVEGSFTWSKTMDTTSGSATGDTFGLDYTTEPWYDLSLDRGLSDFDVPRNLVINALWAVPTPRALGWAGEHVLGGWELALIMEASDGAPFWPSIASDMVGEDIPTVDPPNVAAGCSPQHLSNSNYRTNGLFYLNASCVSLVPLTSANASYCDQRLFGTAPGTCSNIRGDLGRNTILGPGLFNADFSLKKDTFVRKISETFDVQFRAEMFNILNHANFASPPASGLTAFSSSGVPNSGSYGLITNTQHPNRIMQFSLKMLW